MQLADKISSGQSTIPSDAPTIYIENMTINTSLLDNDAANIYYQTLRRYFKKEKPKAFIIDEKIVLPEVISVKIDKKKKYPKTRLFRYIRTTCLQIGLIIGWHLRLKRQKLKFTFNELLPS